jgi:predicted RNA binding protein YcfA (HicA-like mRNA interferase family)
LRILSGKEVCAILRKSGFEEIRRRGSHVVMQKKIPSGTVTVPLPDHAEIRIGTLQSIIRAGASLKSDSKDPTESKNPTIFRAKCHLRSSGTPQNSAAAIPDAKLPAWRLSRLETTVMERSMFCVFRYKPRKESRRF